MLVLSILIFFSIFRSRSSVSRVSSSFRRFLMCGIELFLLMMMLLLIVCVLFVILFLVMLCFCLFCLMIVFEFSFSRVFSLTFSRSSDIFCVCMFLSF